MTDPVKQETEVKEPVIQIVPEKTDSQEVEVDISKSSSKESESGTDSTEKLRNQMFYEIRQMEKKMADRQTRMMEELSQRISGNTAKPNGRVEHERLDEFDAEVERVAQTDWRKAVDMRAERIAEKKLEEKLKAMEETNKQELYKQNAVRIEAKGRDKVLAEYPNIMDESTPEFRAYMEIYNREVNDDPMFMQNPRKHELILPELREKMGAPEKQSYNPEIERLKRVAAGAGTTTRQNTESNKIMLTQEEIKMCKQSGIPVETYARTKKMGASGLKEGMVMDE